MPSSGKMWLTIICISLTNGEWKQSQNYLKVLKSRQMSMSQCSYSLHLCCIMKIKYRAEMIFLMQLIVSEGSLEEEKHGD